MNIGTSLKTISKNQLCSFIGTGGYVELAENDVLSEGSIVTAAAVLPLLNSRNDKGDGILPPGYQRVEFLAANGSQYILLPERFNFGHEEDMPNSGILLKTSDYEARWENYAFSVTVYTSVASVPKSEFYMGRRSPNERVFRAGLNGVYGLTESYIDGKVYEVSINFLNSGDVELGAKSQDLVHNPEVYGAPFRILRSGTVCRLYEAHTSAGEELTHSLIPALDPAGEPCTFDTVTNQPFYNAGTGSFRVGIATLQQVRELQLPDNTGNTVKTLYLSLPQEARTDFSANEHLESLKALNWSLNIQYRDGDIPADYTKVDFLQSNGTQRIDTGVLPADDVGIRVMCGNTYVHDGYPAGMSDSTLAVREDFCVARHFPTINYAGRWGNNMIWYGSPTGAVLGTFVGELNWLNSRMMKSEGGGVTGTYENLPNFTYTTALTIYLFGRNGVSDEYAWREKIYNGQLSRGNDIIRDFVPAINADGVPGMWDKINKQFHKNSGTGDFIVGIKTLNDVRMLNNALPDVTAESPDSITLSLPVEASTDAPAQKALKDLADRGWSIIVQYREDEIPAGYAKVAFLESSGTQYIELPEVFRIAQGDNPKNGIKIRSMDYKLVNDNYIFNINVTVLGSAQQFFYMGMRRTTYGYLSMGINGHNHFPSPAYENGKIYTAELNFLNSNIAKWNNSTRDNMWDIITAIRSTSTTLMRNCTCKLLDCVLSYGTDITRNLIPVINTDGVPGVWDTVGQQFFKNEGTGQFRVGLASKEAVRNLYLTPDVQEGTTINLSVPAGTTKEDTDTLKDNNPNYTFNIQYRS